MRVDGHGSVIQSARRFREDQANAEEHEIGRPGVPDGVEQELRARDEQTDACRDDRDMHDQCDLLPDDSQIERFHPWLSAFDIVLMAPAPGVKLITTDAVSKENQTASDTTQV